MRTQTLLLACSAAGVLAVGVWIGRAASRDVDAPAHAAQAATATARRTAQPAGAQARTTPVQTPALTRPAPSAPGLAADLVDADPKVRRAAVREVARDRDADPKLLLAAARDADRDVGVIATAALGPRLAAGDIAAAELIGIATERGLDERVRVSALNSLGLVASPEASALLVELLARGSTIERGSAAILLVHQDTEIAIPALIRALADAEEVVRGNALESLRARSRGRDFGMDAGAWQAWWSARPR